MELTQKEKDAIYLEKVERARRRPIWEKILEGPRLFALECEAKRVEIRKQQPGASPADVERILRKQLEAARLAEEQGLYVDGPPPPKSGTLRAF